LISETRNEIRDPIHRRRIGYFSTGAAGADVRAKIEQYVQANLATWGQSFGAGKPCVRYSPGFQRYELEWHRPKTQQELAREQVVSSGLDNRQLRADADARRRLAEAQQREWVATSALASQEAAYNYQRAQAAALAASAPYLQPPAPRYTEAGQGVPAPRRYVGTRVEASSWTKFKVFLFALITGASPFRVYWEMRHNALRV
jgi:multidrug efflux pump subunit AcrA (membrane-fusion protein)